LADRFKLMCQYYYAVKSLWISEFVWRRYWQVRSWKSILYQP